MQPSSTFTKTTGKAFSSWPKEVELTTLHTRNDAAGVIRETKEFDTAIRVAYEFYRQHPKETLIIVTADHETGGLGLGVKESSYKQHMDYIQHVSVSKNAFWNEFCKSINNDPNNLTWENAERFINKRLGLGSIIPLSAGEKGTLMTVFQKSVIDKTTGKEHTLYADFDGFTTAVYKLLSTKIGIGWTTYSHNRQRRTILCHRSRSRPFRNCRMVRQYRPVAHHQPTVPFAITAAGLSNFIVIHDKT